MSTFRQLTSFQSPVDKKSASTEYGGEVFRMMLDTIKDFFGCSVSQGKNKFSSTRSSQIFQGNLHILQGTALKIYIIP